MREVELTNIEGNVIGISEIINAHKGEGKLHRAFSIYIFKDGRNNILIQKRSVKKMLFAGYIANTCCSHPFPNEDTIEAAERRLKEECGFKCPLKENGTLIYKAKDPKGNGVEHEHVTLLIGEYYNEVNPNPDEIEVLEWRRTDDILEDMKINSDKYAPWFILGLK
ncbi:MAG: isopentenyl-diphosphate Delta-isomerase [Candidatus Peribacteraceae bacterium]|nr:isopentenyl-diphosphate Delta-isomerase [Candidatus Peribacteraceae bacterium]